jgi:hypothetical protein
LKVQPKSFGGSKVSGHPQGRVGGNAPLSVHDLFDAPWRDSDGQSQPVLGDSKRLEVLA